MPFSRLFRSRWAALLWAGGILWTAYDVADNQSPPDDPVEQAADLNAIAAALANAS